MDYMEVARRVQQRGYLLVRAPNDSGWGLRWHVPPYEEDDGTYVERWEWIDVHAPPRWSGHHDVLW